MIHSRWTMTFVLTAALLGATVIDAHAYIDPGTTNALFVIIAPLLAMLGAFFGYLLWPFRKMIGKFKKDEESGESASGEAGDA